MNKKHVNLRKYLLIQQSTEMRLRAQSSWKGMLLTQEHSYFEPLLFRFTYFTSLFRTSIKKVFAHLRCVHVIIDVSLCFGCSVRIRMKFVL